MVLWNGSANPELTAFWVSGSMPWNWVCCHIWNMVRTCPLGAQVTPTETLGKRKKIRPQEGPPAWAGVFAHFPVLFLPPIPPFFSFWDLWRYAWSTEGLKKPLHSKWKWKVLVTQSCPALCDPMDCSPPRSSWEEGNPWDSPRKNAGVGCHSLLQWIFPIPHANQRHDLRAGRVVV